MIDEKWRMFLRPVSNVIVQPANTVGKPSNSNEPLSREDILFEKRMARERSFSTGPDGMDDSRGR